MSFRFNRALLCFEVRRKDSLSPTVARDLCVGLTTEHMEMCKAVVRSYGTYWDHIRFRKGWATPAFQPRDVEKHFQESAEYVVRIRRHLDSVNPGMKMRMLDGTAQTYLQQVTKEDVLNKPLFVNRLVHHTMQDAKGYVEGLSRQTVEDMISVMEKHRRVSTPPLRRLQDDLTAYRQGLRRR